VCVIYTLLNQINNAVVLLATFDWTSCLRGLLAFRGSFNKPHTKWRTKRDCCGNWKIIHLSLWQYLKHQATCQPSSVPSCLNVCTKLTSRGPKNIHSCRQYPNHNWNLIFRATVRSRGLMFHRRLIHVGIVVHRSKIRYWRKDRG